MRLKPPASLLAGRGGFGLYLPSLFAILALSAYRPPPPAYYFVKQSLASAKMPSSTATLNLISVSLKEVPAVR